MFPRPPAVSAVGYSDLYREYLCRVDACLSLRSALGANWNVGVGCDIDTGDFDFGDNGAQSIEEVGVEAQAGGGQQTGDVRGDSAISGFDMGNGVSKEGTDSSVGSASDRCGCGGASSAYTGVITVQSAVDDSVGVVSTSNVGEVGKNYYKNKKKKLRERRGKSVPVISDGSDDVFSSQRAGASYAAAVAGACGDISKVVAEERVVTASGCTSGGSGVSSDQAGAIGDVVSSSVVASSGVVRTGGFDRSEFEGVTTLAERKELARGWFERKKAENRLATQRADYNFKRNAYLDRARISEKRWEQERLTCEQKLANITAVRFGSKPGYAETLASISDGSEIPPSLSTGSDSPAVLSDGTISPDSSMSVAEVRKMERKFQEKLSEMSEKLVNLELENKAFRASTFFRGGRAEIEGGKVHVYDGTGQYVLPPPSIESLPACYSDYCDQFGNYIEQ